jgi:methylated-DNA-[protein]-cysteine S-methyltransferase
MIRNGGETGNSAAPRDDSAAAPDGGAGSRDDGAGSRDGDTRGRDDGAGQDVTVPSGSALTALDWTVVEAPIGLVSVGCSEVGVASVRFGPPPAGVVTKGPDPADGLLGRARAQLNNYFSRTEAVFTVALDWGNCSDSQRAVLSLLAETVKFGQTVTYGSLARRLALRDGRPEIGARAIGSIMGSNPIPIIVPCHRVLAADGLGGFSGGCGIELKRWLLTFEGALPEMLDFGEPEQPQLLTRPRRASR